MNALSFIKTLLSQLWKEILEHKVIAIFLFALVLGGGYYGYTQLNSSSTETKYVLAAVEKGTLITSVSGSGQVSASNQVDIKPKVSGDVVYVGVKNSQEVKAGTLIIQIDSTEAEKTVRDAEVNLENAKLDLEKLRGPDESAQIPLNKQKAQDNLAQSYEDGFNTVSNVFLDLPGIMTGLHDILFVNTIDRNQWNMDYYAGTARVYDEKALQYRDSVNSAYEKARQEYDQNFEDYKSASRFSDTQTIEGLISETYETTKDIAEAIKNANNLIQFYKDKLIERNLTPQNLASTHLSTLNTYTGQTNSHLLSLLSIKRTIQDDKEAISNADLDLQSQELAVKQRENALLDAKEKLAGYLIRAPFDGVIAEVNVKKGDSASASAAVATLITRQKLAEVSLNEVDVAKTKVGQKVTLTFDAFPELTIAGDVAQIDAIGTVTQGVVNYNVKITFDTGDDKVKPGMSVSAAIITDTKQDVLLVPSSAVKQQGESIYVEVMTNNTPQQRTVETGLSNDTMTEIVSGLEEGEQVVTQTTTANTTTQTQTQSQSKSTGFGIPGLGGGR